MGKDSSNVDDYYSHIPNLQSDGSGDWAKAAVKLKIKAKRSDLPEVTIKEEIDKDINKSEEIVVSEKPKLKIKSQPQVITFEARKEIKKEVVSEKPIVPEVKKEEHKPIERNDKFIQHKPIISFEAAPSIDSKSIQDRFANSNRKTHDNKPVWWFKLKPTFEKQDKPATSNEPVKFDSTFRKDKKDLSPIDSDSFADKKFKSKKTLKVRWYAHDSDDDFTFRRSKKSAWEKKEKNVDDIKQILVDKTGQEVYLPEFLTVKEFSDKIWVPVAKIIGEFLKNWMMATLNTRVDFDTCFIVSETFWITVIKEQKDDVSITTVMEWNLVELLKNDDPTKKVTRAPIISIMWHVDHWKTSILDYIRKTSVASWEAGWITQKIWAYQVERDWKKITFLDTPWHEAFSIMRARWAKLTDIAIIVVAADEWIKPQTIESINHAREAWVPIIVAVNKMDKQWANLDFVKWQLSEQWLQAEDWWWDVVVVPVSAHTWMWIDTLLEMILLVSEMQDLKADPTRPAIATIIESHLDTKLGPLATVLVNSWTLRKWDCVTCAATSWRLKFLKDYRWKNIEEAGPSTPVLISWLSEVVEWWDILQAVNDIEIAKQKAHEFKMMKTSKSLNQFEWASLELLLNRIKTWNLKQLKVVVKAESNWSLEALKDALNKLSTSEIKIHIIHSWVWEINDSDVIMAWTSQAILVWYNVWVVGNAKYTLQNSKIEVINKKVIYHILEKIESIITWMIDIKHEDVDLWEAKIKAIFFTSKEKMVIGCELKSWKVENKAKIRVVRDSKKAWSWEIINLKHWVMDVVEVNEWEFWIAFKWDATLAVWDTLEFYKVVQRK